MDYFFKVILKFLMRLLDYEAQLFRLTNLIKVILALTIPE